MTIAYTEVMLTLIGLLLTGGLALGLTRYRKGAAWILTAGIILLIVHCLLVTQHRATPKSVPVLMFIFLHVFWSLAGAMSLLLLRLGKSGWRDLARAVGLGAPPGEPAEFARLAGACRQSREAFLQTGLLYFGVAGILYLAYSLAVLSGHLPRHLSNALMPMLFAFLIGEWRFGTLEQKWRRQLSLNHPDRFSPPASRWWYFAALFCGVLCFAWFTFAETGIPRRWVP